MSVEQPDAVDIMGIQDTFVILTISDHLDWDDDAGHILALQEKINMYLGFIESGEMLAVYPQAAGESCLARGEPSSSTRFAPFWRLRGLICAFLSRTSDARKAWGSWRGRRRGRHRHGHRASIGVPAIVVSTAVVVGSHVPPRDAQSHPPGLMMPNKILDAARAEGVTTLQIDASFANPRLQAWAAEKTAEHGGTFASVGGRDTITFSLGVP